MKTYTLELNGKPLLAFRAKDDEAASAFPDSLYSPTSWLKKPEGKITVRPATIPERAKWTRASLYESTEDYEANEADEADYDPNGLITHLNREEEE